MAGKKRRVKKKRGKPHTKVSSKEKREEMGKGQVWSVDVLLAVVIFVAVILVFYTTMSARQGTELKDLEAEAENMKIALEKNHEFGFVDNNQVNISKLDKFINMTLYNYTELKQILGIKGDFCIFFEDVDGTVIFIGNKSGIGNPNLADNVNISGYTCGVDYPI